MFAEINVRHAVLHGRFVEAGGCDGRLQKFLLEFLIMIGHIDQCCGWAD